MFKQIITAASLASLLAITGCSTLGVSTNSREVNPSAICFAEVTRLNNLDLTSDETGELMFEYWRTEVDVIRPFVRAVTVSEQLPDAWQTQFTNEIENQFTNAFATACMSPTATFRDASLEAGSFTNVWIDMFIQRLEAKINENSGSQL